MIIADSSPFSMTKTDLFRAHECLLARRNEPCENTNGWFQRYRYPVLTAAHTPPFWRYDLDPATNPLFMERLGINAVFNVGAIDWNGNVVLMARVEGADRKSFFAVAEGKGIDDPTRRPLIQPVSVVYDRLNGLPAGRSSRPVFAWYGDMDLASHFWRMAQHLDMRVTVLLHAPLDPATFPDRKSLALAVWQTVADGASMLRQNRPARPLSVGPMQPDDLSTPEPAYA